MNGRTEILVAYDQDNFPDRRVRTLHTDQKIKEAESRSKQDRWERFFFERIANRIANTEEPAAINRQPLTKQLYTLISRKLKFLHSK